MTGSATAADPVSAGRPTRPCPVCSSVTHEVLYRQRFEDFAAGSITDAYDVVACHGCGMCFASGLPAPERFSDYYEHSSKYDLSAEGAEVSEFEAKRSEEEARFIAEHLVDRAGAVLDIGTATGAFLMALRDIGFTNLHGVEPSADAARKARETHGLDVIAGDARTAKASGSDFSVVSLLAVIEHLVDPGGALREIADLVAADGMLFLLVPDASRFKDHVNAPYQEFSVEHINFFTGASLNNLIASVGLELVVQRGAVVTQSDDADAPAILALCRRGGRPSNIAFDSSGVDALRGYISRSAAKEAGVLARIAELAEDRSPMYVWGTGTNALHLLATSRLAECNILAFLDSNPHYAGRQLAGRTVMGPRDVQTLEAPILIASAVSQTAIATAARDLFGPDVPLILMY